MNVLALTTLYPYPARPRHGIFVENRLRALRAHGNNISVVAPIPYFPLSHEVFGDWASYANPPRQEERHGISITHPPYLMFPKFGMMAAVGQLERVFENAVLEARKNGFEPDILDAHYLFPDGVAATRVGKRLGLPVILTARGSDVTLLPGYPGPRRLILEAVADADHIITVAEALRKDLIGLGADPSKVTTIRNGVDLKTFHPDAPRAERLPKTEAPLILSVGHLIQRKGHDLVISALEHIPRAHLVIVGGGIEEPALRQRVKALKLSDRVHFAGEQPHHALAGFYAHADLLMLGSDREGWPNVLLEAMACGTPCVSAPAGGVAEVITAPEAGIVTAERTPMALATAAMTILSDPPDRSATRRYAEQFGWDEVANDVSTVWQRATRRSSSIGWGEAQEMPLEKPSFILTVDTEELFDWEGNYTDWRVPPAEGLERLQAAAREAGVTPLYFVTYPLMEDDEIGGRLARWQAEGTAYCGLHLHSWSTPPNGEELSPARTYQLHLDPDKHQKKLRALTAAYRNRFGCSPIAHRAGRYGIAPWVLDQLAGEGVMLDFSPSAGFDFRKTQGPDFSTFSVMPHTRKTPHGTQWVIPVSGSRWVRGLGSPHPIGPEARGLGRRLQTLSTAPIRLTPEGNSLSDMQKLSRQLLNKKTGLLTPALHLTSITAGATPYSADENSVAGLLSVLKDYLGWVQAEGVSPLTLPELAKALGVETFDKKVSETA